ncbi:hypothetical protein [Nonomuraea sp. NPDC049400]|uniref:hypothetical protein n=1 Tax=Nonomuraea sp. NPDC049400 TaxID=3364352 RepID=UPI00378E9690
MRNPRTRALRPKADQDVARWQPPYEPGRCRYAAEWTAIKTRWQLSIDPAEQQALTDLAAAFEAEARVIARPWWRIVPSLYVA